MLCIGQTVYEKTLNRKGEVKSITKLQPYNKLAYKIEFSDGTTNLIQESHLLT